MENKKISWSPTALRQFEAAINYILSSSPLNAEKVSADIMTQLTKAAKNPGFFPPDKFKKNNNGNYRAFEKHRYRITYLFANNVILVLKVRHTSRKSSEY